MKQIVFIDFETRSACDLKKAGAYRYSIDPTTEVLCLCWAVEDGPVQLWRWGTPPPSELLQMIRRNQCYLSAWNVGFERRIWRHIMHARYWWPSVPDEMWRDTQADAAALALPLDLDRCAKALKIDQHKDARGTRLINQLCKPMRYLDDGEPIFMERHQAPRLFDDLYEYCRQDVVVERAIHQALPYHATAPGEPEREVFLMTERINDRGVHIDARGVRQLHALVELKIRQLQEEMVKVTGGRITSTRQVKVITEYLGLPNLQKATVEKALSDPSLPEEHRLILRARQASSHASTAKLGRMLAMLGPDGRVRDLLQYHGAATGRYAARGIQIQNFPRKTNKLADVLYTDELFSLSIEDLEERHGMDLLSLASSMLRPAICAPDGMRMICYDYGQIEARGTAWAVRDQKQLKAFRAGIGIYEATAADMYGVPVESIGKDSEERQAGKIAVLSGGYRGGWRALRDFALGYGLEFTPQEAAEIIKKFRAARPELVAAWDAHDVCARRAIANPGDAIKVPNHEHCVYQMVGHFLTMELPSRRKLWFPFARIKRKVMDYETPEGEIRRMETVNVHHMWINSQNQWVERGVHGGSLFQSYVQAICRDLLMEAQLRLERAGYPVCMSVHDETAAYHPDPDPDEFEKIMCEVPSWATGFPIVADGWVGKRYRK